MKTLLNIKIDSAIKEKAKETARDLGMPLSTILNAYIHQLVRSREVYFTSAPRMTPELEKLVGVAKRDFRNKKNIAGPFKTGAEMDAYLDAI
ncbi:MAG: DUF6364 family protein [Candidatus Parcubacteria bacterium]|nr:DUF6364 family protein [Candidatus Parcubacteria bacterium]